MGGMGRESIASKKIAETASEYAPKADVERFLLLMDKLYTSSMVSTEAIKRYSSLYGVVREAEAVQVWNANIGASILYPHIRSNLRAQLFMASASLCGMGQRKMSFLWKRVDRTR